MSPIKHIMVPVDQWEFADNIVKFADVIARAFSSRVSLLHVAPDLTRLPGSERKPVLSEQERLSAGFQSRTTMDVNLRMGDPASEILKYALLEHVDLIAMPTHGRQGIDRMLKGSVTEDVLRHSTVPLLMSNESERAASGHNMQQIKRILLPIYTPAAAQPIMPLLIGLARRMNSEVVLYHDDRGVNDVGTALEPREAANAMEHCSQRLTREGVRHTIVNATSEPVATDILNKVRDMNIDLVAMTTHGHTGLMRGLFGSITEAVLRHSSCPVLSVKHT